MPKAAGKRPSGRGRSVSRIPDRARVRLQDRCDVEFPGSDFVTEMGGADQHCVKVSFDERYATHSGYCCKDATCAICLNTADAADDAVVTLPCCRKPFHVDCLHRWRDAGAVTCPQCRRPVAMLQRPPPEDFEATARALRRHLFSQLELRLYGGSDPELNAEIERLVATLKRLHAEAPTDDVRDAFDALLFELHLRRYIASHE